MEYKAIDFSPIVWQNGTGKPINADNLNRLEIVINDIVLKLNILFGEMLTTSDVVDNLMSNSAVSALSANQGRILANELHALRNLVATQGGGSTCVWKPYPDSADEPIPTDASKQKTYTDIPQDLSVPSINAEDWNNYSSVQEDIDSPTTSVFTGEQH